uniref:Chitin synthase export chaperone n=1 Tax=Zooxanthella nutricula TaxID=1333877 RepID=A0A6U8U2U2_9DINO|mmetsp:Transcript_97952/g.299366  ORF Transcript_97952/g.299366 Transcript_97952/m.299366 type:complete len:266 (+) Transcript_97952:61-858(+)
MAASAFRRLYNLEWVGAGCDGPRGSLPGTSTDDTVGTYATDYAVAVVGFVTAAALLCNHSLPRSHKLCGASFFAWTAFGYGVAGALRQSLREDELSPTHRFAWTVSFVSTLIGIISFQLLANSVLVARFPSLARCGKYILVVSLVLFVIVIDYNIFAGASFLVTGAYSLAVLLYASVVFGLASEFAKLSGCALMITGMVVQAALSSRCGDAAYRNCFTDCPLPAPQFNHNALFHTLLALGLVVLGVAMHASPHASQKAGHMSPAV